MTMVDTTLELDSPNVVSEKFQEGLVILHLKSGKYFDVGDRLVPLMEAFREGISVNAIKAGVSKIEPDAGDQVDSVVALLTDFGLVRETPAKTTVASSTLCEQILSAGPTFFIECHEDLAEMIAADPIHDIDPKTGRIYT